MSFCCAVCVPTHLSLLNPRITAYGAAGGRSVLAMSRSYGVYITGDFLLRKGELLYILVGQQGEDACPNVSLIHYSSSFPVVGSVSPLLCGKSMSRITWTHSACHEKQDEHNESFYFEIAVNIMSCHDSVFWIRSQTYVYVPCFFRNDANVGRLKLLTNVKRKIQKCFSMSLSFGNKNNLASCSPPRMIPML